MFENLKKALNNRIQKNAVESVLTWTDNSGEVHTETVYFKRSKLPLIGDWSRIYPPLNEDGSWNLMNTFFGGYKNLIKLILILGLLTMLYFGVADILNQCSTMSQLPCVQSCLNNAIKIIP